MEWARRGARVLLGWLYRVRIEGLEHYAAAGPRVLIVANHTSFLDAVLLVVFLPDRLTFATDPRIARLWWVRPFLAFVDVLRWIRRRHSPPKPSLACSRLEGRQ
jgi:acyl-[acyl-carrier-protein]-phospholipid O-acyltransferase/long-chain-fatty-acid--[acyl-carrier-protein] ligase